MWHYGCLQSAKDTHYQCLECVATFDGTEVNFEEGSSGFGDDFRQQWKPQCPGCGANLRSLASQGGIEF
jgi:DNA-directed RNA polymerase subunit RPC12/RpoP